MLFNNLGKAFNMYPKIGGNFPSLILFINQ